MEQVGGDDPSRNREIWTDGGRRFHYERVPTESLLKFAAGVDFFDNREASYSLHVRESHRTSDEPSLDKCIAPRPTLLNCVATEQVKASAERP